MSTWRISRRARSDLAEIWRYSHSQWGLEQADRYVAKLYDAFGKLLANPWLGRAVPEALKATSRYRCGSHLIFHRWRRKQLYIIRILHESRITSSISADGWVRPTKRTIPRDSGARDRSLPHREKIVEVQ